MKKIFNWLIGFEEIPRWMLCLLITPLLLKFLFGVSDLYSLYKLFFK